MATKQNSDRAVKVSDKTHQTLTRRKDESGISITRLIDIAVDLAEQDWRAKGIHIPPATAGRG